VLPALIAVFFLTSIISVVTGSTSLITVPAMLSFSIDPRTAIATNMFALLFMSAGAALPFLQTDIIDRPRLPLLIALTLAGSLLGALLLLVVATSVMPLLIVVFMVVVLVFSLRNPQAGIAPTGPPTQQARLGGYVATFALGIYGGFFSGGYVTLLTAAYVALFGMTYLQAIATTKVINIFSSLIAVIVFSLHGVIDFGLGLVLGAAMLAGGMVGARMALHVSNRWLRRIFLAAVILLALKTLVDALGI
jgi:uncharacterized membrane protein YfcA